MDLLNRSCDPLLLCLLHSLLKDWKHGQLAASEMLFNDGCHVLDLAVAELVDEVVVLGRCLSCFVS